MHSVVVEERDWRMVLYERIEGCVLKLYSYLQRADREDMIQEVWVDIVNVVNKRTSDSKEVLNNLIYSSCDRYLRKNKIPFVLVPISEIDRVYTCSLSDECFAAKNDIEIIKEFYHSKGKLRDFKIALKRCDGYSRTSLAEEWNISRLRVAQIEEEVVTYVNRNMRHISNKTRKTYNGKERIWR